MRILITNDDGIGAWGLQLLYRAAEQLAGTEGEVWTVAPATEQSGTGHCVSFARPFMSTRTAPRRYSIEGTPADCVLAGIYDAMSPNRPDLVLSGINRGNNSGENAVYSGTVGAAMEASLHGMTGIALSQYFGRNNRNLSNPFEAAEAFQMDAIKAVLQFQDENENVYPLFYNVNFPPCAAADVVGIKAVPQGFRYSGKFQLEPAVSPSHRRFLWVRSGPQDIEAKPGTDVSANLQNFVTITPMRADMTAYETLDAFSEHLS